MNDIFYSLTLIFLCFGAGMPAAVLIKTDGKLRALAAPPMGLALFSVLVTLTYRYGLPFWIPVAMAAAAGAVALGATVPGLARRRGANRSRALVTMTAGITVLMVCLAPKWTGGEQFSAFRGNVYDHLTYLARSVSYQKWTYAQITQPDDELLKRNSFIQKVTRQANDRPASNIIHAAMCDVFGFNTVNLAYTFLATMQALMFFSALLLILTVFEASRSSRYSAAVAGSAALTIGFPMQYVIDINAWAHLAAMPVAVTALALAMMVLNSGVAHTAQQGARAAFSPNDAWRWAWLLSVPVAGIFYLYPDSVPIYGAAGIGALALWAVGRGPEQKPLRALAAGGGLVLGILACLPFLPGTLGVIWRKIGMVAGPDPGWWTYFQNYLLPDRPVFDHLPEAIRVFFVWPSEIGLGAIGLYFLGASANHGDVVTMLWEAGAFAALVAIVWTAVATVRRSDMRHPSAAGMLVAAGGVALAVVVILALAGRYWAAGKHMSMIVPFVFFFLIGPLFAVNGRHWVVRVPAAFLVAAYLAFGFARPLVAASSPQLGYPPPYPSSMNPDVKIRYDWAVSRRVRAIEACGSISADITDPFLDWYVQLYLTDLGARFSSAQPLIRHLGVVREERVVQEQVPDPDCIVTSRPLIGEERPPPSTTIIGLYIDQRLETFLASSHGSIDLGLRTPLGVEMSGAHGLETYQTGQLRWTEPRMRINVANNPSKPSRTLQFRAWPVGPTDRVMTLTINEKLVYTGKIPVEKKTFLLEKLSSPSLNIELNAPSMTFVGDPRELGVALRDLELHK